MDAQAAEQRKPQRIDERFCLACGKRLEPTLEHLGSLRCLDCRDEHAQLDPTFVTRSQTQ